MGKLFKSCMPYLLVVLNFRYYFLTICYQQWGKKCDNDKTGELSSVTHQMIKKQQKHFLL